MKLRTHQFGVSMVELLIVVAMSGFLTLAIASVFAGNSRTMKTQNALAELNDNGRYALDRISRDVRMMGYRNSNFALGSLPDSLVIDDGVNDSIAITYEADLDCNRVAVGASGLITNRFSIIDNDLYCNNQILVRGIENVQILLGEDLDNDRVANRYVPESAVGVDQENVVSLLISVTSFSRDSGAKIGLNMASEQSDQTLRRTYHVTIALRNRI